MNAVELDSFDRDLVLGDASWNTMTTLPYLNSISEHNCWNEFYRIKNISMLGVETLLMMRAFALSSRSAILEIGPYVGGSTIALGKGVEESRSRSHVISVDHGGDYLSHPHLPSSDIHADWRTNIENHHVESHATLVSGLFQESKVVAEVRRLASGRKFDMLFIDANGDIQAVLQHYGDQLTNDCMLVIDDYFNVQGDNVKISVTQRHVNALMLSETLQQYVLSPFSTWFGRLSR